MRSTPQEGCLGDDSADVDVGTEPWRYKGESVSVLDFFLQSDKGWGCSYDVCCMMEDLWAVSTGWKKMTMKLIWLK